MKKALQTLLSLTLCLFLLGAVMLPVWAEPYHHSDQILSVDVQLTEKGDDPVHDRFLITVVTTPAVKAICFENGQFAPYVTDLDFVGTTPDGNLIWQQSRSRNIGYDLIQICWDDENGQRMVDWQTCTYPERTPEPQPAGCPWCGNPHGDGFDAVIAWFHTLFVKLFGARY